MNPKKKPYILLVTCLFVISALNISSCSKAPEKVIEDSKFFMGTVVQIKVSIDPAKYSEARAKKAIG